VEKGDRFSDQDIRHPLTLAFLLVSTPDGSTFSCQ
jgi:hypothetical protein